MARKRPLKRSFGNIRPLDSGRHQARWTVNGVDKARTFDTEREARDFLVLTEAELLQDGWPSPTLSEMTLAHYTENWLRSRSDLRPSTRRLYEDLACRFVLSPPDVRVEPRIGMLRLREVAPHHVATWYEWVCAISQEGMLRKHQIPLGSQRENVFIRAWAQDTGQPIATTGRLPQGLREAWHKEGRPGLPPMRANPGRTQAAQAYRLLTSIFSAALREERIPKNPCVLPGAGRTKTPKKTVLSHEQVAALADAMPAKYAAAIYLAAYSGLRAGEAFALQRKHVNLETGQVTVAHTLQRSGDGDLVTGPPKSEAGHRTVALPALVTEALREHMAMYASPGPAGWVFPTRTGRPVTGSQRTAMFRRAAVRVGLSETVFHDLRHTSATWAAEAGASTALLMRRLGHSTPRAALIYQQARDEADRALAEQLNRQLSGNLLPDPQA